MQCIAFPVSSFILAISHYAVVVCVHYYCAYRKLRVRFNSLCEFPCCWGKNQPVTQSLLVQVCSDGYSNIVVIDEVCQLAKSVVVM